MSEKNKVKDIAESIKGIAEAVPVYEDLLQPAAQEVGIALQTVAKAIHIALSPVSAMIWGYEEIKDYLIERLQAKFKDRPLDRIVTPDPQIAGPSIEALRFTANKEGIADMFADLLATAMDGETASLAHPSFVEIIKQLSPDEARIMKGLSEKRFLDFVNIEMVPKGYQSERDPVSFTKGYVMPNNNFLVEHRQLIPSYAKNIERLGLVSYKKITVADEHMQDWLSELSITKDAVNKAKKSGYLKAVLDCFRLRLTAYGDQFSKACTTSTWTQTG